MGRPRNPLIDSAVREATRQLLVDVGYEGLTMATIAERAGSSRPALYRRWPSKAELVHDAVFVADESPPPPAPTFAQEFHSMVERILRCYSRPEARAALPGLLAELRDPARRAILLGGLHDEMSAWFAARLTEAVAAGEAREGIDAAALFDAIVGATVYAAITERSADATGLVNVLARGVLTDCP
jgi:AcrR family transcriptional regulator